MGIDKGHLGKGYAFDEWWEIRLIYILRVLENWMNVFRCGGDESRGSGEHTEITRSSQSSRISLSMMGRSNKEDTAAV